VKKHSKTYHIGIDEVGRGPIAGPVTIGMFCVHQSSLNHVQKRLQGITDSKQLRPKQREYYVDIVKQLTKEGLCTYTTSSVSASRIDAKGIVWAIRTALSRALNGLNHNPENTSVFLDGGLKAPEKYIYQETIIRGDIHNWLIATASVIAKVHRDAKMCRYSQKYPQYEFHNNKGYGTKRHYELIRKHGMCTLHRKMWIKQ